MINFNSMTDKKVNKTNFHHSKLVIQKVKSIIEVLHQGASPNELIILICHSRSFWLVLFLISMAGSAYMIQEVWQKWQDSPVIVSFSESWTPVWQIPFPAVTICSEAKSKNKIFNITEAIYKNITNPE